MSYGVQVFSSDGATIFDSNSKRFYTLVGRLVTRDTPYDSGWAKHVRIPAKYTPENSILVMKVMPWASPYFGAIWSTGPMEVRGTLGLVMRWAGTMYYTEQFPQNEFYVYTLLPADQVNDYGVNVYGASGELLFNTESSSLQIVEQINGGVAFPNNKLSKVPIVGGVGVIISANPYMAQTNYPGYTSLQLGMYRLDDSGIVEFRTLPAGRVYVNGSVTFQRTSVATVRLPAAAPPIIPW